MTINGKLLKKVEKTEISINRYFRQMRYFRRIGSFKSRDFRLIQYFRQIWHFDCSVFSANHSPFVAMNLYFGTLTYKLILFLASLQSSRRKSFESLSNRTCFIFRFVNYPWLRLIFIIKGQLFQIKPISQPCKTS